MANSSLSLSVAGTTAVSGTITPRYEYVSVLNETGVEIWVRTDGSAATVDGDNCTAVPAGTNPVVIANGALPWEQAMSVIPAGSNNQWGQWKGGGTANPGLSVSVIAVVTPTATTPSVTIQGAG